MASGRTKCLAHDDTLSTMPMRNVMRNLFGSTHKNDKPIVEPELLASADARQVFPGH